jgi:thiamine biosynthesis protein ThiS
VIRVNDKLDVEWQEGMTVVLLLEACGYTSPKLAVFVDRQFVHRDLYDTYPVADGAEVRVLHLIGGG